MKRWITFFAVVPALGLALGACAKRPQVAAAPDPLPVLADPAPTAEAGPDSATLRSEEARRRAEAARNRFLLEQMVFFDFDRAEIRPDARPIMDAKAALLGAEPSTRLRIDGHADERGSDEYNLALGMRRAASAKQYLVNHGADPAQIEVQSFGEERPLDPRHILAAWDRNRRAEFTVIDGPLAQAP